ncbi:MAG: OmpA family protein [Myxococcales bacterium]|nr:OmpA family protein [Myxococcales bacterium]
MKHLRIGLALFALGCMGGRLEYAATEDAATEDAPDAAPTDGAAPTTAAEPEAPAWLDPTVLDAVTTDASELGLAAVRPDAQTLYAPLAVRFATNSAALHPDSEPALEAARRLLEDAPRVTAIRIAAHSDARGSAEYNLRLTAARALAVARWLVDHGVACGRVEAVGYGEDRPLTDNVTSGGRDQNRRVELWVIGVDGSTRVDGSGMILASPCDPGADPDALLHPDGPP